MCLLPQLIFPQNIVIPLHPRFLGLPKGHLRCCFLPGIIKKHLPFICPLKAESPTHAAFHNSIHPTLQAAPLDSAPAHSLCVSYNSSHKLPTPQRAQAQVCNSAQVIGRQRPEGTEEKRLRCTTGEHNHLFHCQQPQVTDAIMAAGNGLHAKLD